MGVYSKSEAYVPDLKRNAYDGSFQNNLTGRLGYLIPCLCKEVLPGDTFRINAAYGLRFMPTAFPIQTKLKAHVDFFYVRNRNLWAGWKNYITGVGPHDGFPVLSREEKLKQIQTGSLGDYLGLPSTIVGDGTVIGHGIMAYPSPYDNSSVFNFRVKIGSRTISNLNGFNLMCLVQPEIFTSNLFSYTYNAIENFPTDITTDGRELPYIPFVPNNFELFYNLIQNGYSSNGVDYNLNTVFCRIANLTTISGVDTFNMEYSDEVFAKDLFLLDKGRLFIIPDKIPEAAKEQSCLLCFYLMDKTSSKFHAFPYHSGDFGSLPRYKNKNGFYFEYSPDEPQYFLQTAVDNKVYEATKLLDDVPFDISALPFRAYEQIYNSFYRDSRNNPLYVDGVFDPNRFLPNEKGGSDNIAYRLYKRNWEQDFLTTALTSPQYGPAPLVGLTTSGVATFMDVDGNTVTSKLSVDSDGDTVIGFSTTRDSNVNQTLVKLASSGISINDLRGVNSLQRYLEAKFRIGLRYKDQIKAHTGVTIAEDVLDMPEFIGSITQTVDVSQINQTTPSADDPLGSYAGQLSCVGGRKRGFQKYCDENGYIIGILSVVPVPCYSQLLPKHFLKTYENLDYFTPEFNHLGFQPIKYNEVCPLQALNQGVNLNSTFGYQRAWYDYLQFTDEVHGQFRTTLNNFLMCRVFNTVPSINPDFLTVDPDSLNDVFTVNEVNGEPVDTFLGQIHFDITMMRQISRFGTPRLE